MATTVSTSKEEPFSAQPPVSNKEQLTPHKLSVLVLVSEYLAIRTNSMELNSEDESSIGPPIVFSESEKLHVMITLLDLIQGPDLELRELKSRLIVALHPSLMARFVHRLDQFEEKEFVAMVDFIEKLGPMVLNDRGDSPVHGSSVVGIFIRRLWLSYNQMSFSQLSSFHTQLRAYLTGQPVLNHYETVAQAAASRGPEAMEGSCHGDKFAESFGGSLVDSLMSSVGGGVGMNQGGLQASDLHTSHFGGEREKIPFSQKQAELFISQQASLLSMDENKALSPRQLQKKLSAMLEQHPDIAEAHFLSYLNNLRVKEYCTAVHNLYHYFDRNTQLMGEVSGGNKRPEDEISRRYAALSLAALQFNFGHKGEAKAALLEAIRMAQESNDHVCLQHALSWLNLLGEQVGSQIDTQVECSVEKSHELNLSYLTSLGVQALARHNALATASPASVFDCMMKSNIINYEHKLYGLMSVSGAQRAALWTYYGDRECASMCAQLTLCMDTEEKGVFYNGQSICLCLCLLARHHTDWGDHSAAGEIIQHASRRFPPHSQHAHFWQACEQSLNFERALLKGNYAEAERAANNLRAIDNHEGRLHLARLLKERGEVTESLNILQILKDEYTESRELTPDFLCRVLLLMVEVLMVTDNHTAALPHLTHCLTHANTHHLHYLAAMTTLYLAIVQMRMKLAGQALQLLETAMLDILTNGGPYDRARLLYAYAKCKVAAAENISSEERKTALLSAVSLMTDVVTLFQLVENTSRVKDALYYQARLYHQLGYLDERNRCAHRFKVIDQQWPTISKISIHAV